MKSSVQEALDLLDLKLLLVIQRRGHTTKNGSPVDAMLGDTNCLCEGEVDDCEVLRYAVQPPSSWTAPWSLPADSARGEVVQFQDFTFGWHTMQVTEPAQSTLRQGDRDWALFSLLSDSDVSYMLIPFDIFESAQAAHVKCIQEARPRLINNARFHKRFISTWRTMYFIMRCENYL